MTTAKRAPALTARERQILEHVNAGRTNREIADALYLAESTVKTNVSALLAKFGVHRRAGLRAPTLLVTLDRDGVWHIATIRDAGGRVSTGRGATARGALIDAASGWET